MKNVEADVATVKNVNEKLVNQLIETEQQCCAKAQYSRRECLVEATQPRIYWKLQNKCKKLKAVGKLHAFIIVNGTVRVKMLENHPVKPVTNSKKIFPDVDIDNLTICSFVFRDWFFELMILIR